jgi:DNA-binding NarL/FixJ family response regulator
VEDTAPELLILDRQMPVMGGVEALPEIRRGSPDTAVVLYTAGPDAGTYRAAVAAGAAQRALVPTRR